MGGCPACSISFLFNGSSHSYATVVLAPRLSMSTEAIVSYRPNLKPKEPLKPELLLVGGVLDGMIFKDSDHQAFYREHDRSKSIVSSQPSIQSSTSAGLKRRDVRKEVRVKATLGKCKLITLTSQLQHHSTTPVLFRIDEVAFGRGKEPELMFRQF